MKPFCTTLFAVVILCATVAAAQDQPKFQSAAQIKVASLPGFPECAKAAPVNGDPGKGAAVIFAKFAAGCTVPMHWHSANEQLIAVAGTLKMEHQGGTPETVQKGGFVLMPAKHQHNATCTTACEFYIVTDGPFDIHYVDPSGNEIPPDQAIAAKKKTSAGSNKETKK